MAYSVPSTFEPLASSNPVPADTDAMTTLGQRYTNTAAEIETQANNLKQLTSATSDQWKGQAATVFSSKAGDLSSRILQAQERYSTAGQALSAAASPMYDAQQRVYAAVEQAQQAQQQMTANAPSPAPAPGSPPLTDEQKSAEQTKASNYSAAQDTLNQARSQFNSAVDDYKTAANTANKQINDELSHDSLTDSWFERHFGWLEEFFKILGYVILALAVIALIIACPFSAGLLAALGASAGFLATAGTVIGWTIFGLTALTAVYDGVEAGLGKAPWTAFIIDIVGLATFGAGKGIEAIGEGLVDAGTDAAKEAASDAAADGARDAGGEAAEKAYLDPRTSHNAWVEANPGEAGPGAFVFSADGMKSGAAVAKAIGAESAANTAAKAASEAVEATVKGASASGLSGNFTALASQSGDLAKDLATLNAINNSVPNVAKVGSVITKVQGLVGLDGMAQWGSFGAGLYQTYQAATGG